MNYVDITDIISKRTRSLSTTARRNRHMIVPTFVPVRRHVSYSDPIQ